MFISHKVGVQERNSERGLYALERIAQDEVLIRFEGVFLERPTKRSLQVDDGKHLEGPGEIDDFLNHSCDPDGYIDFDDLTYHAAREIRPGEELTFNYLTTEWDMANKFHCTCGTARCFGFVRGFKYLSRDERDSLASRLAPHLRRRMMEH